jgi:CubicO group peptidase (beta-lactamase class C family)
VQRHLPWFEGQFKERVTWRHLLTHTSGLPGGANIRGDAPRERLRRLLRTRIAEPPGRRVEYTDLGFIALWAAAERAAGEPLQRYLERRVWGPLGMRNTRFAPGMECERCAPTLFLTRSGEPYRGLPNDLYARRLGGVAGNAGLFSTAHDMARFAAMIAGGGEVDGVRVLRQESVREMLRQQPGAGRRTLGWQAVCPDEPPREELPCERPLAYGHTGWTGTSLWVDPDSGLWTVLLTNRTYLVRNRERSAAIGELRRRVWEAVGG